MFLVSQENWTQIIEGELENAKGENVDAIWKYLLKDRLVKMRFELYIWTQLPYLMDTEGYHDKHGECRERIEDLYIELQREGQYKDDTLQNLRKKFYLIGPSYVFVCLYELIKA